MLATTTNLRWEVGVSRVAAWDFAERLRSRDLYEIWSTSPHASPQQTVAAMLDRDQPRWTLWENDLPLMVMGFDEHWPGRAYWWVMPTKQLRPHHALVCLRWSRLVHEQMARRGIKRFWSFSMLDEHSPHGYVGRWIKANCYRPEGILRSHGRNGDDFMIVARLED